MLATTSKLFTRNLTKNILKTFTIKNYNVSTVFDGTKTIAKTPHGDFEFVAPLEALVAVAASCEIHIIQMVAKQNKVTIEKIEVDMNAQFDFDTFSGKSSEPNTYKQIDINTRIWSSEQDKKKLEDTVNTGIHKCPVLNTLKLAGIKFNKTINYL